MFKAGNTYTETIGTGRGYEVKCVKVTKCFASFEIDGSVKRFKIENDNNGQNCFTGSSFIRSK